MDRLKHFYQHLLIKLQPYGLKLRFWLHQQCTRFLSWPKPARYFALAAFFLGFCLHLLWSVATNSKNPHFLGTGDHKEKPIAVSADTITRKNIQNNFTTYAYLKPAKEIMLHPNVGVVVRGVAVEVGAQVKAGQILAVVDSETQALRAQLDSIDLQLRNLDFGVTMVLAKKSFLSQNEFKQKELEHKASQIRKRLAELDTSSSIRAPIAGTVAEIALKQGDFVDNSTNYYIKIVDTTSQLIHLYLPQSVALRLQKGSEAMLSHTLTREQGKSEVQQGVASIRAVAPFVDPKTGSVFVELVSQNVPDNWISGMYVEVSMKIDEAKAAIAVPNAAIVFENGQSYVYRIAAPAPTSPEQERGLASNAADAEATKVERIAVKTGIRDSLLTEIREGLEEFDQIVVEGQGALADGAKVEIVQ